MATRNQVLSLFGATPEQIMQQQAQEQAQAIQNIQNPYQQVGAVLGTGLARLFGGESPEVTQARQMQEALEGVNPNDPVALRELAQTVSSFAPERALQIATYATDLENQALARKADELSIEASQYRLNQAQQTDPIKIEGLELANEYKTAQIKSLRAKDDEREEALKNLEQQRTAAVSFLKEKGVSDFARLVEDNLIDPDKAISAYITAQDNSSMNITEVGNYTIGDREVIGAMDTDKGIFYELNPDGGWIRRPASQVTQGRKPQGSAGRPTPRVMSKTLTDQYDTAYDNIIDNVEDTDPALYTAMTKEGVIFGIGRDELTSDERISLYEKADSILQDKDRYPSINTTEEALRQAILEKAYGSATPQTSGTPQQADPFAGAPIR